MTGKIKKIISTENGETFVADIEDIENRISQNSSKLETAKQELSNKCNEALSQAKAYTDQEKAKYLPLTGTAENASNLGGYPSTNYVRSINNISPDENGNVKVTTSGADLSGIVKSVNNIQPDSNGNVTVEAGKVKTVNNVQPDEQGNIELNTVSDITFSGKNLNIESTTGNTKTLTLPFSDVKTVNNVKPDSEGNVLLGTEKSTFNKVVYDTGYFSIGTNATYKFDLTGSDLENVSKENVNIRLVAKVTTAHNGFEVGDIAQLSTAIDHSAGNTGGDKIDMCAFISGNTLRIRSGNNPYLSIFSGVHWLEKANVQIKAALTAFVPDDGSILLIAEDQTNTSKLIGLPDGTLTWQDKNIVRSVNNVTADENGNVQLGNLGNLGALSPVHYSRSSNFETTGRTSIKLPSYLSLMVNGHYFRNDVEVTVDISDTANWDSTETDYTVADNRAGKDFYIYAVDDKVTKSVHVVLSANSTVPTGYTDSSSRKIGGFHCLCADVGTLNWRNPATLKDEAHWLSGYVKGDILPYSVWDLLHRAESSNEGMVYSPETHMWYDIYLSSWDGSKLVSVFGGTTADGASSKPFHGEMFAECAGQINKELISRDEFIVVAKGSNERTAIHGSTNAGTTGGHVDTANRRMISNIGLEDCCGFLWQWCKQSGGANGSTGWENSVSATPVDTADGVYGQSYGTYYRALVGGHWEDSSSCGSRCVNMAEVSVNVLVYCGGRLSSRERVVTGL